MEARWVDGWVDDRKIEENEAVGMSYCMYGLGGWVGGWVEEDVPSCSGGARR